MWAQHCFILLSECSKLGIEVPHQDLDVIARGVVYSILFSSSSDASVGAYTWMIVTFASLLLTLAAMM